MAVSILTRALTRVQPVKYLFAVATGAFQSSLELSPECNGGMRQQRISLRLVSILTRALTRVQRSYLPCPAGIPGFQSSLELSPECNMNYDFFHALPP